MTPAPARSSEARPLVSIVYPMLNEADNAVALAQRMSDLVAANPDYDLEFVAVDDGSTDDTMSILRGAADPAIRLRIVTLSRNFGSHAALSAGFAAAAGDAVIHLGADLQEPVELVGRFLAQWRLGYDVVWGIRAERMVPSFASRVASKAFSQLFTKYSELPNYPAEGPSGGLCDRAVVDAVNALEERHRNVLALIAWVGFNQTKLEFEQLPRTGGSSKWTTRKLVKLAVDSLVQFSSAPIRFMSYAGTIFASIGFVYALFLAVRAAFVRRGPEGWTTVIVAVLLIGGLQLLMLGVLGEYLWRGVDESRRRTLFVVDRRRSNVEVARRRITDRELLRSAREQSTGDGDGDAERSERTGGVDSDR